MNFLKDCIGIFDFFEILFWSIINNMYRKVNYYYTKYSKDNLEVKLLTSDSFVPCKASKEAAGYDLYSPKDYSVEADSRKLIMLDISLKIPDNCYGRIAPRSGLSLKKSIDIGAGVIDSDYRGNVGVLLINNGSDSFEISKGDRIAQLIIEKINTNLDVKEVLNLSESDRGFGGFGSTGK